jgi:hypothetical protein
MPAAFEGYMPSRWVTCTPSDSTDLTGSLGLYVGGTGNVSARCLNDSSTTVVFATVPAGTFIPGNFTRVMAATTATTILVAFA